MKSITYYASDRTKYFKRGKEVTKYYASTYHEKIDEIGDILALKRLGEHFSKHYLDNKGQVNFKNCKDTLGCDGLASKSLRDMGFRPLTSKEEEIFQAAVKQDIPTLEILLEKHSG
ncbi:MAG: hypothetical protein ACP5NW_04735 [Candidatus Woesearchaeota archaeon]